jgi:hypothetical protein
VLALSEPNLATLAGFPVDKPDDQTEAS